jgi:hypothetical protein
MAIDIPVLIGYLKKIHLFRGLSDEQLAAVAEGLNAEKWCEPGEIIVQEGGDGHELYLIYSGRVEVTHKDAEKRDRKLATLVAGDYFGEEALLTNKRRSATVSAVEKTLLLVLTKEAYDEVLKIAPKLRANLEVVISSRKLARSLRFKWLQDGEVVYFLARKHPILLWKSLIAPLFVGLLMLFVFIFYLLSPSSVVLWVGGIGTILVLGWCAWNYIDWTNDYYIVTNRRVIWLEKVIGLYDSRQEAPLSTVLSVGVETSQLGRMLDYGDVIVRTFVGKILFNEVQRPYQAASLIEEHWSRSRETARKADVEAMQQVIREKLGMAEVKTIPPAPTPDLVSPLKRPSKLKLFFANFFKVRFEEIGGIITYRKHPFVLFLQTWKAGLALLVFLALVIYRLLNLPEPMPEAPRAGLDAWVAFGLVLVAGAFMWWLYEYLDWSNDKFQVTHDQIFDIDRTPLGRESRKAAALDNILSTEYRRIGFLQVLLNYGNVVITVGGTQMVFEDVANPPLVQQDIDQRRMARLERKKQGEALAERERMSDWIATYHHSVEEFRRGRQELEMPEEGEVPPDPDGESGVK